MKTCWCVGSSGLSEILIFCEVKGGGQECGISGGTRGPEGSACPPDVESGYLLPIFVFASLFADFFDRESDFDDAFVVAHASLHWKIC